MNKIFFVIIITFLSSCAHHSGMITSNNVNSAKKKYVDVAIGYSKTAHILGIGGLSKEGLINEAKQNLILTNPLQKNQQFDNATLDLKSTNLWFYKKMEVFIVSDVVETDSSYKIEYSDRYLSVISNNKILKKDYFTLGEGICYHPLEGNKFYNARILEFRKNYVTVFFTNKKGHMQIKAIPYRYIYKTNSQNQFEVDKGYKINQSIKYIEHTMTADKLNEGQIVGMNKQYVLIRTGQKLKAIDYRRIKSEENDPKNDPRIRRLN